MKTDWLLCLIGTTAGSLGTHVYMTNSGEPLPYPLEVKLHRFEMQGGAEKDFQEWIQWHDDAHGPIIETLEREKMYFEAVFRDPARGANVIYWLEVHGKGGESVTTSTLPVDQVHKDYLKRILVPGSKQTAEAQYILMPDFVENAIRERQEHAR